MKVLVTGAAGFIGSNFVHYVLAERPGWRITALDLLTYAGNLENLAVPLDRKQVDFVKIDITDPKAVEQLFQKTKFDLVINFAAESHVDRSLYNANAFVSTNVLGTQNLLNVAKASGVKRFVQISTDEVYGSLGPTGRFLETTPLDPTSPYAASKAAADLMALAFFKTHKFDLVITRCTNNYGPYQFPEKLIPLFITNAIYDQALPLYGDGLNVRSWLYVTDHCEAILKVAESGKSGEVYNIGGSEECEMPNIAITKTILKHLGKPETLIKPVQDRPAHDRRYAIDYSKIQRELGWQPRTPLPDGLAKTIEWYRSNEQWWRQIKSGEYLKFFEHHYGERLAQ